MVVLALLGMFYVLPPVYAALGRVYAPELTRSGRSETLVLSLPQLVVGMHMSETTTASEHIPMSVAGMHVIVSRHQMQSGDPAQGSQVFSDAQSTSVLRTTSNALLANGVMLS